VVLALTFARLIDHLTPELAVKKLLGAVTWGDLLDLALLTPTVVVFAEILPKAIFRARADRIIVRIRPVILLFLALFKPLILVVERFTSILLSPLSEHRSRVMRQLTRQDVINLISPEEREVEEEAAEETARAREPLGHTMTHEAHGEEDRLTETTDERRMIHNIIQLQETRAYEIMTPLVDLAAVSLERMDMAGFKKLAQRTGYSRFPVYRDRMVNMIGYIDIFRVLREADCERRLEEFVGQTREATRSLTFSLRRYDSPRSPDNRFFR
jgi:CBS domain containing-hemolysin-like protein